VDRAQILAEIQRTAEANGGTPLGRRRFAAETGIRENDWSGRYWARWTDALAEAGYSPNSLQHRYDDESVVAALVDEIRCRGRMPTVPELRLRRRRDPTFPSQGVFSRLGTKRELAKRAADFCRRHEAHRDILDMIDPALLTQGDNEATGRISDRSTPLGFVYLLRSGRFYKIGHTFDLGRRKYDLAIQLPEPVAQVYAIRTDDPAGIERYWHERFADRRKNGEWFELTRDDVAAFKRRKFM
jgi:hypothetical protein